MNILSFGAGVQSTTILAMSCVGVLPRPDRVLFADTQWEPEAVYSHLEWCKEFAASHGVMIETRTAGNLRSRAMEAWRDGIRDGKRRPNIPAYVKNADGSRGVVLRQCTQVYKIEVVQKFVRETLGLKRGEKWPLDPTVRMWIGISRDEAQRMTVSQRPAIVNYYPLIEAQELQREVPGRLFPVGYSRSDCLAWLRDRGLPEPPRSACIGCPYRDRISWQSLTPSEFADACEFDAALRENPENTGLDGLLYLHPSLMPLSEADLDREDIQGGLKNECGGICGT